MYVKFALFALLGALALASALQADDPCTSPNVKYWPKVEDCRSYTVCADHTLDKCFPLFRRFNRETLQCDWWWRVDCSKTPQVPQVITTTSTPYTPTPKKSA